MNDNLNDEWLDSVPEGEAAEDRDEYVINFDAGVLKAHDEVNKISGRRKFTRLVAESQTLIEPINRYDDFDHLKIDLGVYEKQDPSSPYGIMRDPAIHGVDEEHVILRHQETAAKRFLRELRGFGLLADVVGSGKTYEAGLVLSELAARNLIKSMLIVVPAQVLDSWREVLENKFGLGEGVLYTVVAPQSKKGGKGSSDDTAHYPSFQEVASKCQIERANGKVTIRTPILVDVDVFSQWEIGDNIVFDVIVVDEAHHLCKEDGAYSHAMKLLSQLMDNKKRFKASTYCLLLTATPHSGNLANMFRLWYFVRKHGGTPSDFEEKEDTSRTAEYNKEKTYYLDNMCRGATNVTDFIRRVKHKETVNRYHGELMKWIARENEQRSREGKKELIRFDKLDEYGQSVVVDNFLMACQHSENEDERKIWRSVITSTAQAYHAVLRSIMIRQENKLSRRFKKHLRHVFFCPLPQQAYDKVKTMTIDDGPTRLQFDYSDVQIPSFLPVLTKDGAKTTVIDYLDAESNRAKKVRYSEILGKVLKKCDDAYKTVCGADAEYSRKDYNAYYQERFMMVDEPSWKDVSPLPVSENSDYKLEYLKKLLSNHAKERVIVFFDYELGKKENVIVDVVKKLQADANFKKRLILSAEMLPDPNEAGKTVIRDFSDQDPIFQQFNGKSDAILLVITAKLTEGANLQAGKIIINYQVTPDPVAMDQRIGRVFRLGQSSDVKIYSFADVNKLEGYALAYFVGIGLLASNSGDATILAGSNSDQMAAIRCKVCGNVDLMARARYKDLVNKNSDELKCYHIGKSQANGYDFCVMEEISVSDYKCEKCEGTIVRPVEDEGYECFSINNDATKGKLCNNGERGNREVYCDKICAMSHCNRFKNERIKCHALELYRNTKCQIGQLENACRDCVDKNKCVGVWAKCRVTAKEGCFGCQYSDCNPKPFKLVFNEKWEAKCPRCGGKLREVLPKTFAAYVRNLWKFPMTGDKLNVKIDSFCKNLGEEASKVNDIRTVLQSDKEG